MNKDAADRPRLLPEDGLEAPLEKKKDKVEIRKFDIKTIEKLGREMYEMDQAATVATDALIAATPEPEGLHLRGWIVEREGMSKNVIFIRKQKDGFKGIAKVSVNKKGKARILDIKKFDLTEEQLFRFKARQLAIKNMDSGCAENYNTVVLDDPEGDNYLVYLLPATTKPGILKVTGYYRFTVSENGKAIKKTDKLYKGCLEFKEKRNTARAHLGTHIVSNTPVESHVYLSLISKKPFIIVTPDGRVWMIAEGKISDVTDQLEKDNLPK